MKKMLFTSLMLFFVFIAAAQHIENILNAKEAERIERYLTSDSLKGRKTFTEGIDKAADFIAAEFAKNKLGRFGDLPGYFEEFAMIKAKPVTVTGFLDQDSLNNTNTIANTTAAELKITSLNDYEIIRVQKDDDFSKTVFPVFENNKNTLILVDTFHAKRFKGMQRFTGNAKFSGTTSQVFILTAHLYPKTVNLLIRNTLSEQRLKNVIGVIPGTTLKNEMVIFSAHYDHLGIGKPNKELDSIFNGANDDAAGTTAVIMLSDYFQSLKKQNKRTLVFVAFTAEEIGGFGSRYFSKKMDPAKVVAMFNIEMIGTESKWGKNSAYITGFEKSDMGPILQKNLQNSVFKFEPDPYPSQNLFYRSDNATLAELGVPAHTISTSKMDSEKFYHTLDDEIGTLDMENMAAIIRAIAISCQSIINGTDTPTRVQLPK
jgi:hypothetical protein